jgi:DNA-binding CsgD family transcriptional regulator
MRNASSEKPRLNDEEQRVFALLGEGLTTRDIADRLDMSMAETATLVRRVVRLRGTPTLEAIQEGIERMKKINFV